MLFVQGIIGVRGREHEGGVVTAVDVLTVLTVFSNSSERIKRREEDVRQILPFHQGDSYIFQVVENFPDYLQAIDKFPVHVELGVTRRHGVGMSQRLCRRLYCANVSPSFENACSGSHEASVIGYPRHLIKYW